MDGYGLLLLRDVARIVVGLLMVLFWPGYCLQAALFPRRKELSGWQRLALSCGLSNGAAAVMAPLLDRLPWGVRFEPVLIGYVAFILACTAAGAYRRRNLPEEDRLGGLRSMNVAAWWKRTDASMRKAYTVQAVAVLGGVGVMIANMILPHPGEHYSEFYILGAEGLAEDFMREASLGKMVEMRYGIANHEGSAAEYRIKVLQQGELIGSGGPVSLEVGEVVEASVEFVPAREGKDMKIEFWLMRGAEQRPYRTLELWMDVKE